MSGNTENEPDVAAAMSLAVQRLRRLAAAVFDTGTTGAPAVATAVCPDPAARLPGASDGTPPSMRDSAA